MRFGLTEGGWACLLVAGGLFLAGYNSDLNLLYLMASALGATVGLSLVFAIRSLARAKVERDLPEEVTAEEPFIVRVRLERSRAGLARWGTITLEERLASTGGGAAIHWCFFRDLRGATAIASYRATVASRGEHRFERPWLVSCFPFGLAFARRRLDLAASFIAYPRRGRLLGGPPFPVPSGLAVRRAAPRQVGEEFRTLRDFLPGDNPKLIHWRLSARRDVLQVRELEEPAALERVTILLDTCVVEDAERGALARFELGVSFAATLCENLVARGHAVSLGTARERMPFSADRKALLQRLALVRPESDCGPLAELAELRGGPRLSPLIAILHERERTAGLPRGRNVRWYLVGGPEFDAVFQLPEVETEAQP